MPTSLRELIPSDVAVVETRDQNGEPPALCPQEAVYVEHALEKRRRDFALGRACARMALAALDDRAPTPIPVGEQSAPVWPEGIVGSITHTKGFCAAAVAHASDVVAIGIDAEFVRALSPEERQLVVVGEELCGLPRGSAWDVVAFSAKEAVFKAWFPLTRQWLDFVDVQLALDHRAESFVATLRPAVRRHDAPARFTGRFAIARNLALTAVLVRHI